MKNKKFIYLALILLVCIISISAVSAADDSASDINSANENENLFLEDRQNEDTLNIENENLILEDSQNEDTLNIENENNLLSTPGNFRDLNSLINDNDQPEITLDRNYTYDEDNMENGITIDREVTINGNGYTINANGKARIFSVTGSNVVFKNIVFMNGLAAQSDKGGAIWGDSTAINCTFKNNGAYEGGAMYCGTANNCTFISNNAIRNDGGAILNGTANNCTFINNTAYDEGGAMKYGTANNCTFIGNDAMCGGGMSSGTANQCFFFKNTYSDAGEAMFEGTANDCTFILIFSSIGATADGTEGKGTCKFIPAELIVSNFMTSAHSFETLPFNLSAIVNDEEMTADDINTTIKIFKNEQLVDTFYALTGEGWEVDLDNGDYIAEFSIAESQIEPVNVTLSITDGTTFTDLNRTINGNENSEISLDKNYKYDPNIDSAFINGIIINRTLTINGNGFAIDGLNIARTFQINGDNVVVKNINFVSGNSTDKAGAIYWHGNNGFVEGCNFTNNSAKSGGAIYFDSDGTVSNCNFNENTVEKSHLTNGFGGAIFFQGDGKVVSSTFNNNQAKGQMYNGPDFEAYFIFESDYNRGGAIFFRNEGEVINSTFNKNEASYGSAIFSADKALDVKDSAFIENKGILGGSVKWYTRDIGNSSQLSPNKLQEFTIGYSYPGNNYINAIYNFEDKNPKYYENITLSNVTYWAGKIVNSNDGYPIKNPICIQFNLTITDSEGNVLLSDILMTNLSSEVSFDPFQIPDSYKIINYNLTHYDDDYYFSEILFRDLLDRNESSVKINTAESEFYYEDCTIEFTVENRTEINVLIVNENGDILLNKNTSDNAITIDLPVYDGYYNITLYNYGNFYYAPSSDSKLFKILPKKSEVNISPIGEITYGNTINVEITGKYLTTLNVTVYDSNQDIVFSQNFTETNFELPILNVGEYNLTVINYGNESIVGCENSTIFNVIKANNNVVVSAKDVTYGENTIVTITADIDGEYSININGTAEKINVADGVGNISISLKPGSYWANGSFDNPNYSSNITNASFNVQKITTKITAAAVATTYNVNKNLVITLKDNKGNPISGAQLTVNLGSNKKYTTDKNGQVKVAVAKLVPKTYTAKISFAGNSIYKASSTTAKVVVKKASPKITAKAKTFKFEDKTKKYTITLKDNKNKVMKNKKVTLKVNGKTYTAKTNSKGIATFKLSKLTKKGKFTTAITYAGDKYYKKVTKKAKVTVKAPAWKTVAKGSKAKATVKKIQKALKNNGYYLTYKGHYLKIDRIYHDCTVRSVKQFQKAKTLKVTGKVDYKTAKKLKIVS